MSFQIFLVVCDFGRFEGNDVSHPKFSLHGRLLVRESRRSSDRDLSRRLTSNSQPRRIHKLISRIVNQIDFDPNAIKCLRIESAHDEFEIGKDAPLEKRTMHYCKINYLGFFTFLPLSRSFRFLSDEIRSTKSRYSIGL